MKKMILMLAFFMSSTVFAGAMSDIDLETREAISFHLDLQDWDAIHSLQFASNQEGCFFTTQARVEQYLCFVCFEGEGRNFTATKVSCQ